MSRNLGALALRPLVEELQADPELGPQIVHTATLDPSLERWGELDPPLPPALSRALAESGVQRLWSHQTAALAAVRRNENVLITTPTASGKSLVYQLPVLEEAIRGGPGHALFLFPLKALAQDQATKFERLATLAGLGPEQAGCAIYDGDTPPARRGKIRRNFPRVVLSNPDMVHHAILGNWTTWGPFLADLRWLVLDELHTYRGIFGSHFHHVLERLFRLARAVGGNPLLIASSATAGNAEEFAETLTGRKFCVINTSGAPREGRHMLLIRPRSSPYTTTLRLLVRLLSKGLKTIVFTKARRITELLYSWLRRENPERAERVACYRAGFLPEERRRIEHDLFTGKLDGVISTSALEMGIDVGGLDACILVGFPGSMMATWQRSGRVGRTGRESLTAMVALPDALDQYLLGHPEQFLERPYERLIVDPGNELIARAHLPCAAAELPLAPDGDASYLGRHAHTVEALVAEGRLLTGAESNELFCLRRRPQRDVALRGMGTPFSISVASGRPVGLVDGVRVYHECHPGAIYLHSGRQYLVEDLDLNERRVRVAPVDVEYFTVAMTEKETEILEVTEERRSGAWTARLGKLRVTERVVGFERKQINGQQTIDQTPLELPPMAYETVGVWWEAPRVWEEDFQRAGEHFMGSLHACEHAAIGLMPLLALCDRGDLGGISMPFHPQVECGVVFLYDGHSGGVGIAARGFAELELLFTRVLELLSSCPCEIGCPSCVQSPKCGNGNRPLDKRGAAHYLRLLLGLEESVGASRTIERPVISAPPQLRLVRPSVPAVVLPIEPWEIWPEAAATQALKDTVLFDLETLRGAADVGGWGNCHRMGVAIGVVCHLETGRFEVYREDRVTDLWAALRAATLVIGFNSKRFDYRVLAGYCGEDLERQLPSLDLLEDLHRRFGFRVGLGHLAQETLGVPKSANGLTSLQWVKENRFDLITDYCRKDVELLRDLYLFGRREGFLYCRERRRDLRLKLPVSW
jgi:DEAD/DEAH box helicase domain-containing protein